MTEAYSHMRDQEELSFRKRFGRMLVVLLLIGSLSYIACEHYRHAYKVMATSRNMGIYAQPTITIREISRFLDVLDDNPPYRFEYYCYSYPEIWSCQSYTGKSYKANSAQIEWAPDGTATVSLDHNPIFTCSKDGLWSPIRH